MCAWPCRGRDDWHFGHTTQVLPDAARKCTGPADKQAWAQRQITMQEHGQTLFSGRSIRAKGCSEAAHYCNSPAAEACSGNVVPVAVLLNLRGSSTVLP